MCIRDRNMRVDEFLLMINDVKKSDKEELKKLAVECGLTSVLKKEINELSKGYKQDVYKRQLKKCSYTFFSYS